MSLFGKALSAGALLSLMILAGRVSGFLRDVRIGTVFGLSDQTDLAVILLTTPDLLVNLLLAGGLSAALVPEFTRLDRSEKSALFIKTSVAASLVFGVLAVVMATLPQLFLALLAPAYFSAPPAGYGVPFAIAAIALPFAALAGVSGALLNAEQKFFIVGAGTLLFNAVIVAILSAGSAVEAPLFLLAIAIAVASVLRYASQLLACLPHLGASLKMPSVEVQALARRFAATLTASTLILLMPIALRSLISLGGAGNIAAFSFASKLVELPTGIVLSTLTTITFPHLSRLLAANQSEEAWTLFVERSLLALLLAVAITLPAIWFAQPIASVLFGYGQMTPDDVRQIGDLAQICFLTLPAIALSGMAIALLNARRQARTLLLLTGASFAGLLLMTLPGLLLGQPKLIVAALPLANALLAALLLAAVWREKGSVSISAPRVFRALAAVVAITVLSAIADSTLALDHALPRVLLAGLGIGLAMLAVIVALNLQKGRQIGQAHI